MHNVQSRISGAQVPGWGRGIGYLGKVGSASDVVIEAVLPVILDSSVARCSSDREVWGSISNVDKHWVISVSSQKFQSFQSQDVRNIIPCLQSKISHLEVVIIFVVVTEGVSITRIEGSITRDIELSPPRANFLNNVCGFVFDSVHQLSKNSSFVTCPVVKVFGDSSVFIVDAATAFVFLAGSGRVERLDEGGPTPEESSVADNTDIVSVKSGKKLTSGSTAD
mmetsp:Transcript_10338/g.14178  ORF Transcript_10338/g.14178 Transcript_10338/m.14178 type:complete len:223 (+) Transcript_10338:823-1491(+)